MAHRLKAADENVPSSDGRMLTGWPDGWQALTVTASQ